MSRQNVPPDYTLGRTMLIVALVAALAGLAGFAIVMGSYLAATVGPSLPPSFPSQR